MLTLVDVCIFGIGHETSTAAAAVATAALLLALVVALLLVAATAIDHLLAFLDDVVHVEGLGRVSFRFV